MQAGCSSCSRRAVLAGHFYFLTHVGGLWRDEASSLNLAQGERKISRAIRFRVITAAIARLERDLYQITCNNQLGWLGRGGSTHIEDFKRATPQNLGDNESITLQKLTGWKN